MLLVLNLPLARVWAERNVSKYVASDPYTLVDATTWSLPLGSASRMPSSSPERVRHQVALMGKQIDGGGD